jgi:hypothetical protein
MSSDAVRREAQRGQKLLEFFSQRAGAAEEERQKGRTLSGMFPSTREDARGSCSPLGGTAEFPWGPKRKGD